MDNSIVNNSLYYGTFEPSEMIQIPGAPHEHEIRVWLPPSYNKTDRDYPVLWVTDNFLEIACSAITCSMINVAPELIVVSVGAPRDTITNGEFVWRRFWDFLPETKWWKPGYLEMLGSPQHGGAPIFRDYLIDVLRPALAEKYRMHPTDHGLFGHSAGCLFTTYCLFSRPDGFAKYMGSSAVGLDYEALAKEYFAGRSDLAVRAYFASGGEEGPVLEEGLKAIVSHLKGMTFPSLETTYSLHPGMDHFTEIPVMMMEGVRWLWREGLINGEWMAMFRGAFDAIKAAENAA